MTDSELKTLKDKLWHAADVLRAGASFQHRKYFLYVATGATVPSLRYNNFASMKFVLPEISLCNSFYKPADDVFGKIDNLQQQITNLPQQRACCCHD